MSSRKKSVIGKRVKFTKRCLKWKLDHAWEIHVVDKSIIRESDADSYMVMKLLALGFPYRAKVTGYGIDEDTYKVEVKFRGANLRFEDDFFVDKSDVRFVK